MDTVSVPTPDSSSVRSLSVDDAPWAPYFLGDYSSAITSWDSTDRQPTIEEKETNRSIDRVGSDTTSDAPRKKAETRKRKSWGRALPQPTTNLPPKKRARTEEEKEQRLIERILRNRRAAHFSRERRRLKVESLEEYSRTLELRLIEVNKANSAIVSHLNRLRHTLRHQASSPCAEKSAVSLDNRAILTQGHYGTSALQSRASGYVAGSSTGIADDVGCLTVDPASLFSKPSAARHAAKVVEFGDDPIQLSDRQLKSPEESRNEYGSVARALAPSTVSHGLCLDINDHSSDPGNDFWLFAATAASSSGSAVGTSAPGNAMDMAMDVWRSNAPCNLLDPGNAASDELLAEASNVVRGILLSRRSPAINALEVETPYPPPDALDSTAHAVLLLADA